MSVVAADEFVICFWQARNSNRRPDRRGVGGKESVISFRDYDTEAPFGRARNRGAKNK